MTAPAGLGKNASISSLPAPDALGVADLRAEGVYPFAPMPEAMARAWAPIASRRTEGEWEGLRAVLAARAAHARNGGAPELRDYPAPARLVTPTSSVASFTPDALAAIAAKRSADFRRLRFKMRAASQELVTVDVREDDGRSWYRLNEETGELEKTDSAPKVTRVRMGLKMCGRAVGMDLPEKGQKQAGRKIERAGAVSVGVRPDGRAALGGIHRCASVWACPVCAYHISRERGEEVQAVFDAMEQRGGAAYLLTLTTPHYDGWRLEPLRRSVSDSLRKVRQDRTVRETLAALGYLGDVRALEVTHGANGWHPHLHLLLWFPRPLSGRELVRLRRAFYRSWAARMERATGHRPNRQRGCDLRRVHQRADYVAKLGIAAELTSSHGKEGRGGSRTPWQILRDWTEHGREADARLWVEWTEGIHGARQLTWSGKPLKALRAELLGEAEATDEELAERETDAAVTVAEIPRKTWERMEKALPGWACWVLETAERFGGRGLVDMVRQVEREMLETGAPPPWWRGWGGNITPKGETWPK